MSSGTSSKQLDKETDAKAVGYGSMILEGVLAVVVIFACTAGVGMGYFERVYTDRENDVFVVQHRVDEQGQPVKGQDAWRMFYAQTDTDPKTGAVVGGWNAMGLPSKLRAFVNGGGNFLHRLGIEPYFAGMILGVMVACFAATTLDTATRLYRYVLHELGEAIHVPPLTNKYVATSVACAAGLSMALFAGSSAGLAPGKGGMLLWPIFGATNQVLAGLGFVIIAIYLIRRQKSVAFLVIPAVLMLGLPSWAMLWNTFHPETGWLATENYLLFSFGLATQALTIWLVVESVIILRKMRRLMRS